MQKLMPKLIYKTYINELINEKTKKYKYKYVKNIN